MVPYDATTDEVTVRVRPVYLDDQSDPLEGRFAFAYHVRIVNGGPGEVQLLRRRWVIRDDDGRMQEVEGAGVVGQQPVIGPGESYTYQSYCVLETFTGSMEGSYLLQREHGERFRAQIPRFDLRAMAN